MNSESGKSLVLSYEGNQIALINKGNQVFINATQMGKSFKKKPDDWLRTDYAQRFIRAYTVSHKCDTADLVIVRQGGNDKFSQGTWVVKAIAIEFGRWLSLKFALWMDNQFEQLYNKHTIDLTIISRRDLALLILKAEDEREEAVKQIQLMQPKYELAEAVLASDDMLDVGQAAKILGYGRNTMFQILRDHGILFKNRNEPQQGYINAGYFILREVVVNPNSNSPMIVPKILVTQRGLDYLRKKFKRVA